jgi:hypothetical protein
MLDAAHSAISADDDLCPADHDNVAAQFPPDPGADYITIDDSTHSLRDDRTSRVVADDPRIAIFLERVNVMNSETQGKYEHYKLLHESVQACHSYSWQLTAIYVPAIGAGIYMLAKAEADMSSSIVMGILLMALTLYWYFNQRALDGFNKVRYGLLKKLEAELFPGDRRWMAYYETLFPPDKERPWYSNFSVLRGAILAVYLIVIGWVIWVNVSTDGGK